MDSSNSGQDLIRCDLCESPIPPLHCDLCHTNLCKACVGEHVSDFSKEHRVVQFSERGSNPVYPKCSYHSGKACELQCTKCDTPVCCLCVAESHQEHTFSSLLKTFIAQREDMKEDLEELMNVLCPEYKDRVLEIDREKSNLQKKYDKLTIIADQMGEKLHREIDIFINKKKNEIRGMKWRHLVSLNKQKEELVRQISEMEQSVQYLNELLDTNELSMFSPYKSRNAEFRELSPIVQFSLPDISLEEIDRGELYTIFCCLWPLSLSRDNKGFRKVTVCPVCNRRNPTRRRNVFKIKVNFRCVSSRRVPNRRRNRVPKNNVLS